MQVADRVAFMEVGRIVEQATPPPIKPDGSYGTGASPALPGDEIVPRALMDVPHGCPSWMSLMDVPMDVPDVIVASPCPRDQIPLNDFHPRGCGASSAALGGTR